MTDWRWIAPKTVHALHDRQLAEHGGLDGVRDQGLVESALVRPINLAAYGEPDAAALAAAYTYGLACNHGFLDGNKRIAWLCARLFLADNGCRLTFDKIEAVRIVEGVASGDVSEDDLAAWFRARITRTP